VGGNAHQPKHGGIVSDVQSFAEIMQPIARKSAFRQELLDLLPASEKAFHENQHPKYNDQEFGDVNLGGD
jgi:hypothetical protein